MIARTFKIKGMHCASCAAIIEKTFKKTAGVSAAQVNYGSETAKVEFDEVATSPHRLAQSLAPLGYSIILPSKENHSDHVGLSQSKQEKLAELSRLKGKIISVMPLAVISILVMAWEILARTNVVGEMPDIWEEFFHHLLPFLATYALFVVGQPYLVGLYRFLRYGRANMDTLIGLGTLVAFIYSFIVSAFQDQLRNFINTDYTYYDITIVVIAFITLGKYLETRSKIKTGDAIEKLLNLQAKTALVVRHGQEVEMPISEVMAGDAIIVKPGSKIPVDGVIATGSSFIDESMVTGEPIPMEKNPGNSVIGGTLNTTGAFTFKATKVGSDTLLSHIIKMVEEAQGSKAPIQALADKISAIFVPTVIVLAFVTLGLWLIIGANTLGFSQALSSGLVSFVGILVIACPCALGLATPTAIIVGVGKGAKEGILVKDAATLEKLHQVTTVVFDKTGTITKGKPELVSLRPLASLPANVVVSLLASLEARSEHPIAHAITSYADQQLISYQAVEQLEVIKGKGLKGRIENEEYFAGNLALIRDLGLPIDVNIFEQESKSGQTPIIVASKVQVLGVMTVADALKPEAKAAVAKLRQLGKKTVMLTGDNQQTARYIADQAGIDEVMAEVLPQDKLAKIKQLQDGGEIVAMAGDGINDAPALAQADVGIAMATGTDVAIESAGITLLSGDISKLAKAIELSKITMRGIKQNLFWAFIYNLIGIPLAGGAFYPLFGWLLNPVFAGLAMAFSSVSVVANSLRLKTKKL